jgi:molybdate transport system substrate-binding protein
MMVLHVVDAAGHEPPRLSDVGGECQLHRRESPGAGPKRPGWIIARHTIDLVRRAVLPGAVIWVSIAAAGCGGGRGAGVEAAPVLVSAAVSLSAALEELGPQYTRAAGVPVRFNFAASNVLARQIVEGAAVDAFISADEAQMGVVADAGLLDAGTRVVLLTNRLAVVTRGDWPRPLHQLADLGGQDVRRIAVGDPAAVPAGVYARQALERAGLWPTVQPRLVPTVSVRAALAAADEGNADAAIVYRTDVVAARHARLAFVLEPGEAPPIVYPAAVTTRAPNASAARAWLKWLRGPTARATFERHGFGVPSQTP